MIDREAKTSSDPPRLANIARPAPASSMYANLAGLSAVLAFLCFGAEEMFFNLWLVQARNPWRSDLSRLANALTLLSGAWAWLPSTTLGPGRADTVETMTSREANTDAALTTGTHLQIRR